MQERIVEIEGLSKNYSRRLGLLSRQETIALDNLNLSINRGEIFALLGPNGAGKTTTLNIISGLTRQSFGRVRLFGENLEPQNTKIKFRIGFLSEDNVLPGYLSLKELLVFLSEIFNLNPQTKDKRTDWLLSELELKDLFKRRIRSLSAGQKRLAALACAFFNDPQLLILDEPTVYLDPLGVRRLTNIINNFKQQGKTVIISSHILSQVEKLCDHVAILNKGRLKFSGDSRAIAQEGSLEDCFIKFTSG